MIDLKRILLGTDFSDGAKEAQRYACGLAETFGAELHVLHVLQDLMLMMPEPGVGASLPQSYLLDLQTGAEQALDRLLPADWCRGHKIVRTTRMGNPYGELVRYATENEIDLIVLGTHGRSALFHLFLGNVAEKVVRHSPCPVLTVRAKPAAEKMA